MEINLISFDIPYPANYGGVIDIFHKIKALTKQGISIHLHCFKWNRHPDKKLNELCKTVNYYERHASQAKLFKRRPYIVVTRSAPELIDNLLSNNFPILFEGLHSCFYLDDIRISKRIKIVRTHNIEHDYYYNLGKVESNIFRKYYFNNEAAKLKRYEKILNHANGIAAISKNDKDYFKNTYNFNNIELISAFHPDDNVNIKIGKGDFSLYHGSLDVGENNKAALYLVNNIFNDIEETLIIAGNKPSTALVNSIQMSKNKNIKLINNISTEDIYELIRKAHINVLPTFQATGIKLKLLAALHNGRHSIVTPEMVKNTGLESLCIISKNANDMKKQIIETMNNPFTKEDVYKRENILLNSSFDNKNSGKKLIKMFL